MDTNIWLDFVKVAAGILTGGGLWAWIKAREDKRKTPYDMFRDLLAEQKKFYEERNADYEPYQKSELELNLATITGKLNGEGESVTIFPEGGPKSAGTAFDSFIVDEDGWCRKAVKRVDEIDLGAQTIIDDSIENTFYFVLSGAYDRFDLICQKYTTNGRTVTRQNMPDKSIVAAGGANTTIFIKDTSYNDAASIKTALSGVSAYYEIAPVEYVLDTPIQMTFQAKHGGVIRQLPENGSAPTTAPMRMSVTYALDAVSILSDLPENYVSKESLQAMLSAMQSAGLFSAYTMTFNESTGKYEFTFTANA